VAIATNEHGARSLFFLDLGCRLLGREVRMRGRRRAMTHRSRVMSRHRRLRPWCRHQLWLPSNSFHRRLGTAKRPRFGGAFCFLQRQQKKKPHGAWQTRRLSHSQCPTWNRSREAIQRIL